MTTVPRHFDIKRLLQGLERRMYTLELGQRSASALQARVDELETRLATMEAQQAAVMTSHDLFLSPPEDPDVIYEESPTDESPEGGI